MPHGPSRNPALIVALAVTWAVLLAALAPFDLQASEVLAGRTPGIAEAVRRFGEWPAWVLLVGALVYTRVTTGVTHVTRAIANRMVVLAVVSPLAITQALKHLWGRVRFRDLAPGAADFTPFYLPSGPGAGESFPSGHAAMATVVLPLALYLARRRRWVLASLLCAYPLAVAAGRVLAGAHYLTDVVFSLGLGVLLTAWMDLRAPGDHSGAASPARVTRP